MKIFKSSDATEKDKMIKNDCLGLFPPLVKSYINYSWGTKEHVLCYTDIQEMAHFYPRGRKSGRLARGQETLAKFSRSPLTKIGLDEEGKLSFINLNIFL